MNHLLSTLDFNSNQIYEGHEHFQLIKLLVNQKNVNVICHWIEIDKCLMNILVYPTRKRKVDFVFVLNKTHFLQTFGKKRKEKSCSCHSVCLILRHLELLSSLIITTDKKKAIRIVRGKPTRDFQVPFKVPIQVRVAFIVLVTPFKGTRVISFVLCP